MTEEQKAEIVRRYAAGESMRALARTMGVSKQTVSYWLVKSKSAIRPSKSKKYDGWRVDEEEAICKCYQEGMGVRAVSSRFHTSDVRVTRILRDRGIAIRDLQSAYALLRHPDIGQMSAEALWQTYAAPGSGYPSMKALGIQFGVTGPTIRRALRRHGIQARTAGEQMKMEWRSGRFADLPKRKPDGRYPDHIREANERIKGQKLPQKAIHRLLAGRKHRDGRLTFPCGWCGEPVYRYPSRTKPGKLYACNAVHNVALMRWKGFRSESPRPLILVRLRQLVRDHPYKALPFTRETVEKAAQIIGAAEPEIIEVLAEGR